jgi:hypothetical protein
MSERPNVTRLRADTGRVLEPLGAASGPRLYQALAAGLLAAAELGTQEVKILYVERFRRSPTGTLSNEIQSFPDPAGDPLTRLIGVPPQSPAAKYAYLLGDEVKIILPVKGQYLTIPTDANLQGSGTPRYKTPRDIELQAMGGHFRRLAGKLFFGIEEAGQRFVAFFALVKKSVVRGRNILRPAIDGAAPQMTAILQERVDELLSQGAA